MGRGSLTRRGGSGPPLTPPSDPWPARQPSRRETDRGPAGRIRRGLCHLLPGRQPRTTEIRNTFLLGSVELEPSYLATSLCLPTVRFFLMVIFTFPSTSLPLAMVTPWSLMRTRPPGVKPSASTLTRTLKSCLYVGAVAGFFTFVVVTALAAGGVVVGV